MYRYWFQAISGIYDVSVRKYGNNEFRTVHEASYIWQARKRPSRASSCPRVLATTWREESHLSFALSFAISSLNARNLKGAVMACPGSANRLAARPNLCKSLIEPRG